MKSESMNREPTILELLKEVERLEGEIAKLKAPACDKCGATMAGLQWLDFALLCPPCYSSLAPPVADR